MNLLDTLDRLYTQTVRYHNRLKRIKVDSIVRYMLEYLSNWILPICFAVSSSNKSYRLNTTSKQGKKLIVSLTTFPARINKVHLTIETILRQSKKPDLIILWLSRQQFESLESLPKKLLALQRRGLIIRFVSDDLRSHKKYYYILKEYPQDDLITIDDDLFYRSDMIECLLLKAEQHPSSIIANYAHRIKYDKDDIIPYQKWENNQTLQDCQGFDLFFGSGGGTLFRPGLIAPLVLAKDDFMNICPFADDIWLNAMCRVNDTDIVKTSYCSLLLPIISQSPTLASSNVNDGLNDSQLRRVRNFCLERIGMDPFRQRFTNHEN